jgi:hypothetical protein
VFQQSTGSLSFKRKQSLCGATMQEAAVQKGHSLAEVLIEHADSDMMAILTAFEVRGHHVQQDALPCTGGMLLLPSMHEACVLHPGSSPRDSVPAISRWHRWKSGCGWRASGVSRQGPAQEV